MNISLAFQGLREVSPDALVMLIFSLGELMLGAAVVSGAFVYWCVDKKLGQRMLCSYVIGFGLNQAIKNIACVYRPWILDSRLYASPSVQSTATGYSFPSGHTVSVSSVLISLARSVRTKPVRAFCVIGVAAICLIRIYVGAHTAADVITAVVIAFIGVAIAHTLFDWAEAALKRDGFVAIAGIVVVTAITAYLHAKAYPLDYLPNGDLLVDPQSMKADVFKAAGSAYGLFIGWFAQRRLGDFHTEGTLRQKTLRLVPGALFCGAWFVLSKTLLLAAGLSLDVTAFVVYFVLTLFMVGLYPIAIARFQQRQR